MSTEHADKPAGSSQASQTRKGPDAAARPSSKAARTKARINFSAVGGILGGIALLVAAIASTASEPLSFINLPSAVLVVGGTTAATLITYSFGDLGRSLMRFWSLLRREHIVDRHDADRFVRIAGLWRAGKIQAVEAESEAVKSPFVKTGLRLLVDGTPPEAIVTVLEWRMRQQEALERKEAAVFRTMASYAPAFGMAGTLIGIVNMLRLMGQGATPREIGENLAFALITTLYGLVLANAFLKPIAAKIETKTYDHLTVMSAIAHAFREISSGHGPSHIREVLAAIGEHHNSEMNDADALTAPTEP